MISETKRKEIEKDAQEILKKFGKALERVDFKEKKIKKKGMGGYREESEGNDSDSDFRERMFANAPKKNEDSIIAERKEW